MIYSIDNPPAMTNDQARRLGEALSVWSRSMTFAQGTAWLKIQNALLLASGIEPGTEMNGITAESLIENVEALNTLTGETR